MAKKKTKRRKPKKRSQPVTRMPGGVVKGLVQARRLAKCKQWEEAIAQLLPLHERYPSNAEVLIELVNIYYDTDNLQSYLRYVRKLYELGNPDPELLMSVGGAYLNNEYPFAAYHYLEEFARKYPDHQRASRTRKMLDDLEGGLPELMEPLGVAGEEGIELGFQHDLLRADIELGDYPQAQKRGREFLERYPDFIPARNNLSLLEFQEGNSEGAIEYAQQVLRRDPDNFQASGNLARYLYLVGRVEEAQTQAEHLDSMDIQGTEFWAKKAETFTYLGDHARVDAAVRAAEEEAGKTQSPSMGFIYHLGGVAALEMGDENLARTRWKAALKLNSHLGMAQENLRDLSNPQWERHAPWPYPMQQWLPQTFLGDLRGTMRRFENSKRNDRLERELQKYFESQPALLHIFSILLKRGGEDGRELVINMARFSHYPPVLEMLQAFAFGQDGPDATRLHALNLLTELDEIPAGPQRMWLSGEWSEIMTMGFEIGDEGEEDFAFKNAQSEELLEESIYLMRAGEFQEAQELLEQARKIDPDHPSILNNLAKCMEAQGDTAAAMEIVNNLYINFPNYLFSQVGRANQLIADEKLEEAREILNPLLQRKKLHYSEFFVLADAEMRLQIAMNQPEGARQWLDMWRQVDPKHPNITQWEMRIGLRSLTDSPNNILNAIRKKLLPGNS